MKLIENWLNSHARANIENLRFGFHMMAEHPLRGLVTSSEVTTQFDRTLPSDRAEVIIRPNPLAADTVHLFLRQGGSEDRYTMTLDSLGSEDSALGLFPALRAILGHPPGWN